MEENSGTFEANFILKLDWNDQSMISEQNNPKLQEGAPWNEEKQTINKPNIVGLYLDRYDAYEEDVYVTNAETGHIVYYKKIIATFKDQIDMYWFPFDIQGLKIQFQ